MIETTYTKLFSSIVTSTIWREDDKTRIVWITLLAIKNRHGEVAGSIPGLAALANVSIPDCEAALQRLSSPDPYSRTKENEGRRIEAIEGGWRILNHARYRNAMSEEERRAYQADWQRKYRQRKKGAENGVDTSVDRFTSILTHADAESDTDTKKKEPNGQLSPAQIVTFSKELERVTERMRVIKATYADHQSWDAQDRKSFSELKARRGELNAMLGVKYWAEHLNPCYEENISSKLQSQNNL